MTKGILKNNEFSKRPKNSEKMSESLILPILCKFSNKNAKPINAFEQRSKNSLFAFITSN